MKHRIRPKSDKYPKRASPASSSVQFMIAEFERIRDGEIYNRNRGEARVNLFITLFSVAGAFCAAMSQLVDSTSPREMTMFYVIVILACVFLLVIGCVTITLLIERWRLTVVYLRKLARIRKWFVEHDPTLEGKLAYSIVETYPPYVSERLPSSSLVALVSTLNAMVVAAAFVVLLFATGRRLTLGTSFLAIGAAAVWFQLQYLFTYNELRKLEQGIGITVPPDQELTHIYRDPRDA